MAKVPRNISGREAVRVFERAGFVLQRRSKKGHLILARGATVISVPDHRTLKTGTLGKLISDAGLTAEEFIELL
jgi:predicted RNA binding protein YcfA (HicA-like mRNA interferase family)